MTGKDSTVLPLRERKEQYGQLKQWYEKFDLSDYQRPSVTHDCDRANGEYGEEWVNRVTDWHGRGATPKKIHKSAE